MTKIGSFGLRWKRRHVAIPNLGRQSLRRSDIAIDRLSRFSFFDADYYASNNPDIGAMDPSRHFIAYGGDEGREVVRPTHVARVLGRYYLGDGADASHRPTQKNRLATPDAPSTTVAVFHSSLGNIFMRDIAQALAACLRASGATVIERDENSSIDDRPRYCIYVAPHEFFLLGRGSAWVRDDVLESACIYCTEQVQTPWFWRALPFVLMARTVIDMSASVASAFAKVMPACHILPGIVSTQKTATASMLEHPLLAAQRWWTDGWDERNQTSFADRPLDLCFLGAESPARQMFFARNADWLCCLEALIYLRKRKAGHVLSEKNDSGDLSAIASFVARHSRILLNIHRDEFPYFEWHRIVHQGMANGALVVSEPCFDDPHFKPDIHFIVEDQRHLGELIQWILNTEDGRKLARSITTRALHDTHDYSHAANVGAKVLSLLSRGGSPC